MIDVTANGPYMMKRCYVYHVTLFRISRVSSIVAICRIFFFFFIKIYFFLFDFVEKINLK